jgi:hypothetical protein
MKSITNPRKFTGKFSMTFAKKGHAECQIAETELSQRSGKSLGPHVYYLHKKDHSIAQHHKQNLLFNCST